MEIFDRFATLLTLFLAVRTVEKVLFYLSLQPNKTHLNAQPSLLMVAIDIFGNKQGHMTACMASHH